MEGNKSVAAEEWPTTGVSSVTTSYNASPHQTIHMPPDLLFFGRMRTPELRRKFDEHVRAMCSVVNPSVSRLPKEVTEVLRHAERVGLAASVSHALETRGGSQSLWVVVRSLLGRWIGRAP